MALPVRHRDILLDFYNDHKRSIWSRDLVGKVILTNGILSPTDIEDIVDEILTSPATISVNLSGFSDIEAKRLLTRC